MPIYMKVPGVQGSATAEGFEKQIELTSFQLGAAQPINAPANGHRTHGRPSISEVVVTKSVDDATHLLLKNLLTGATLTGDTEVAFVTNTNGNNVVFCTIKLTDVMVSSLSTSSGGDDISESASLNFSKFDFSFVGRDGKGAGSAKHVTYDIEKNKV